MRHRCSFSLQRIAFYLFFLVPGFFWSHFSHTHTNRSWCRFSLREHNLCAPNPNKLCICMWNGARAPPLFFYFGWQKMRTEENFIFDGNSESDIVFACDLSSSFRWRFFYHGACIDDAPAAQIFECMQNGNIEFPNAMCWLLAYGQYAKEISCHIYIMRW